MENNTCYQKLIDCIDAKKNVLVFDGHVLHMRTLIKSIDNFALALRKLGFVKGDVLTLYLPTSPQAVVAFYACSKMGVIANFVHPLVPIERLKDNLEVTRSKGLMYYDILIKNGKVFADIGQILIKCSLADYHIARKLAYMTYVTFKSKKAKDAIPFSKLIKRKDTVELDKLAEGSDVACTMHSGGTEGEPKIVKLSNNALNGIADSLDSFADVDVGKEYALAALPVFHAYGLGVSIHTCMVKRFNVILMPRFNGKQANRLMRRYHVTLFAGVPVMFKKMASANNFEGKYLSRLKHLWCGGDAVSPSFVDSVNFRLSMYGSVARLMPGYGLTEVSGVCAANTPQHYNRKSCGKPIPGVTIEIWDDSDNKLPINTLGEIAVNSPSIMDGYMAGDCGIVEKDEKKWIKTGDIGYLNKDGYLFVVDRKKRSVKVNAINIFPAEIEALARKKDYVEEACAVPYLYDNKTYIRLYVTPCGDDVNENSLRKDLLQYCRLNLIKYAVPKEIVFIKEMPRTKFGKVDYNKLELM